MGSFLSGRELSRSFYQEVVQSIVAPRAHAAALIGEGSEVLGYDTDRSTDHAWGLRLQLFVDDVEVDGLRADLEQHLPEQFGGHPVRYYRWQTTRIDHHVEVASLHTWLLDWLQFDPRDDLSTARWLATPQQLLLEVTAGEVYRDDTGELTRVRDLLSWYPHDVWLYLLACEWARVADHGAIVERTAEVGDELGSRLATATIIGHLIRVCFLLERRFAPYAKWFGTAFRELGAYAGVAPHAEAALVAVSIDDRVAALDRAYRAVARRHNDLAVTSHVEETTGNFDVHIAGAVRPYTVLNASRFVQACRAAIGTSPLTQLGNVGSIDQLTRPTDEVIHFTDWSAHLATTYRAKLEAAPTRT